MRYRSFSLIELLVVIAVLSILTGLLQPAFKKLQSKSQALHCQQKQQNIVQASIFFREDKNNHLPLGGYISSLPEGLASDRQQVTVEGLATHYVGAFASYLQIDISTESLQQHRTDLRDKERLSDFLCPVDSFTTPSLILHKSSEDLSRTIRGSNAGYTYTSYGSNESFSGYYNGYGAAGSIEKVAQPDRVFFIADAKSPNPYDYNVLRAATSQSTLEDMLQSSFAARLAKERHDEQVVTSYIDGHTETLDVLDLNKAYISKGLLP